ncbi:DUF1254 domain-containing protein [Ectopseudomonas mendocina]|uniref:DUF1254 domain-containing protein n=1 Tax=Ectopseudomonas mendocina TaxID=300 RepID=A0ABZ2RFS6_ECTME
MRSKLIGSMLVLASSIPGWAYAQVGPDELREIARDTYIYAYPLLVMQITRDVSTNVEKTIDLRAPVNQLAHARGFPDHTYTDVARPNADTLYSAISFDVSKEPLILEVPDAGERYYMLTLQDWWTDVFAAPGTRTTGNGAQTFALVGPNWKGKLPQGVTAYQSPTNDGLMIGRTKANGKADYTSVHSFQSGMRAYPLSAYGKSYSPPSQQVNPQQDMSAPPLQIDKMSAEVYFARFGDLLQRNPPHASDYPILDRMKRIGLVAGEPFELNKLSPEVQQALRNAANDALPMIKSAFRDSGVQKNGWSINLTAIGTYGTDYLRRAGVAYAGLGANVVEDAIYPSAYTDSEGKPLQSDKRYVMHFPADQLPPVRGFWSLTMYDERQLFAANPIDRFAIGDRDKLSFNPDGSLDLYIQREAPEQDKQSNWLPAPASGTFSMNMRLYWPQSSALTGKWTPPQVKAL